MSVKTFEDARWHTFDQKIEFRHRACLELVTEGTVLDVGCGDGLLLKQLRAAKIEAVGVDISPEAVAQCTAEGLTVVEHSLDAPLPFPDNAFDTVVLLDVLEHVYEPLPVLLEARRVARVRVVVGVPNFSSLPARLQTLFGDVPENNRPGKGHVYWFNHSILLDIVRRASLAPGRLLMNTFSPFAHVKGSAKIWPNVLALSFVLELKKE